MEETFPPEIRTEILIRLPVKPLLRFRCVSKSWCAQIDDSVFIKLHLKKSIDTNSTLSLVLTEPDPNSLYWVSFDSLNNTALEDNSFNELDYPLKGPSDASPNIRIVGSCNGLLCFGNASGRLVLMNPSTRKHYILPFLIMDAHAKTKRKSIWGAWAFGFGYDSINDDYKVVRLGQYVGIHGERYFETETMIYSLKSNSWRQVPGMSYVLGCDQKMGVLVGDALHWLVSHNQILLNPDQIVAFDLSVENFREVPGPNLASSESDPCLINLGVVENWLSVFAIYKPTRLDIWVMKEYGVKNSWTILFSFTPNEVPVVKCMRTLIFSKNGDEVLLGLWDDKLLWYDMKEKCVKRMEIHTAVTPFTVEVFRGSLVPLCANNNKKNDVKKARPLKGRKNRDEFLSKWFKLAL